MGAGGVIIITTRTEEEKEQLLADLGAKAVNYEIVVTEDE